MTRRICFTLLLIVVVASFFGCAGRQVYTQSEELDIVKKMSSQGNGMLYLYSTPNTGIAKMDNRPLYCAVDDVNIGDVLPGEYDLHRLSPGNHELSCYKMNRGALGIPIHTDGKLSFQAGAGPVYIRVLDGVTVYAELKVEKTERPDNFSEAFHLAKACIECAKP